MEGVNMKRYGMVIKVRPGCIEDYKRYHENVSSEVVDALHESKITNNTVFYTGDLIFMYLEYIGDNFEEDWKKYASNPKVKEWSKLMSTLLAPYEIPAPKNWWTFMEEVYHQD